MKKIVSLILMTMLLNSNVEAFFNRNCHDFYAEIFGGANFLQTERNESVRNDFRTGYMISGSLGYRWCYGLRVEAEYAYRRNEFKHVHFFGRNFSLKGHYQSSSYMANLLWDMPVACWGCNFCNITPFIGAGIGYDFQRIHGHTTGITMHGKSKHFAWQVMAGFNYPLFCNTELSLEYKFHKGGFHKLYNHTIGVGLKYNFG